MAVESGRIRLRGALRRLVSHGSAAPGAVATCRAPSASLYLDQRGDVRACCQNAGFPLGNVTERSLSEIWHGERAARLRAAVAEDDLSLGCNFCRWQVEDGSGEAVFARTFDHLRAPSLDPVWPQQLELSLSNACNLQCVMCNGEWSSSIRTHREGLPPLPTVYDDAFFDGLADFLPHLKVVKFLGGEPFLGKESLRVMEMLAELGSGIQVHVTTNGTQWSPRIERILDRLAVNVVVSLDGVHQDTYESIRVGSSFESVVTNIDRFVAYTAERGTGFSLSHCLMTSNWREFDDFLDFAEERGSEVYVNTVTEPYELSLYHLPPSELRGVVEELRANDAAVGARLSGPRRAVWADQLGRLDRHLDMLGRHSPPDYVARHTELGFSWVGPPDRAMAANEWLDDQVAAGNGMLLTLGPDGSVVSTHLVGDGVPDDGAGLLGEIVIGSPAPAFVDPETEDDGAVVSEDQQSFESSATDSDGRVRWFWVARAAQRDEDGIVSGVRVLVDTTTAWSAARSWAEAWGPVGSLIAGLQIDQDDRVEGIDGPCVEVFGMDPTELVGRQVDELSDVVDGQPGLGLGAVEDLGRTGRVHHHARPLRDGTSSLGTLHSFSESDGERTTVWAVRLPTSDRPGEPADR